MSDCLSSLEFREYHARTDQVAVPQHDTTQWIWKHDVYKRWLSGGSGVLWIQGKPGSGKSTLAKEILTKLSSEFASDNVRAQSIESRLHRSIIADFFFSARGSSNESSHRLMLQSLLYRILQLEPNMFTIFQNPFRALLKESEGRIDWPYNVLKDIFLSLKFDGTSKDASPVVDSRRSLEIFLLIDAMDESEDQDENGRRRMETLALLSKLVSKEGRNVIKVLVLSRPAIEIEKEFSGVYQIHMQKENQTDIEAIIDAGIHAIWQSMNFEDSDSSSSLEEDKLPGEFCRGILVSEARSSGPATHEVKKRLPRTEHRGELGFVRDYLIRKAEGVILWVVLIIKELTRQVAKGYYTIRAIKERLESLPTDLKNMYWDIVGRLSQTHSREALVEARLMLVLVAFCKRPLTLREFRDAVAIPYDTSLKLEASKRFDERRIVVGKKNWAPIRRRIVEMCGCLLEITTPISRTPTHSSNPTRAVRADHIVQFLHQTSREFLLSEQACSLSIDRRQANDQLAVLASKYLRLCVPMDSLQKNTEFWTAEDYQHFVEHLSNRPFLSYVVAFLPKHMQEITNDEARLSLSQFMEELSRQPEAHGWAFLAEMESLCKSSLAKAFSKSQRENAARFKAHCLAFAIQSKELCVVQLMLGLGTDPHATIQGWTLLQHAASTGLKVAVQLLLEKVDCSSSSESKYLSDGLLIAVDSGHEEVVVLLLDKGNNAETCNAEGYKLLHIAADKGFMTIVEQLLMHGADPNARAKGRETPLHLAARNGHHTIAQLLLQQGADCIKKTEEGQTALHYAAENGYTDVARVLLQSGVSVNSMAEYGETPLFRAVEAGHEDMVLLLLGHHVDIGTTNFEGETVLHRAAAKGYVGIASRLIENGATIDTMTKDGRTALHEAVQNCHHALVRFLLRSGANTQIRDWHGRTPSQLASCSSFEQL